MTMTKTDLLIVLGAIAMWTLMLFAMGHALKGLA